MPDPCLTILHVVVSLDPGGMENGIVNVARALDPAAFETHVCCLERRGKFAERLPRTENVSVLGKTSGFSWPATLRLRREISRTKPHVVHTHNLGPLIYGALASGLGFARPILHGEHAELTPDELTPRRLRQRRILYRCCRKIHTVSHALRDHLAALGFPASKLTVIANGVDTTRFTPGDRVDAKRTLGLPADSLVLGAVGRFGPHKRHAVLIDAFGALARQFTGAHLLIVGGGGPEEEAVSRQASESEAAQRIHLTGFQNDTCAHYRAMDLLVVASVNEGLSNALLEAMACGVPALAHLACGNSEAITDGADGFVADLGTPEKLHAHVHEALADPARLVEMGRRAREKVLASFSLDRMIAGYARVYRDLAAPHAGGMTNAAGGNADAL
jgi:glycosyltransferase involved in cell wall biosynthesis